MKRLVKRIIKLERPAMVQEETVVYLEEIEDDHDEQALPENTGINGGNNS